jgi:tRNA nucleotidyltransferase/poly(A) polymerase
MNDCFICCLIFFTQVSLLSHCFSYSPSRALRWSTRFPRRDSSSVAPTIDITKTEKEIFDFFQEVLEKRGFKHVTIRVVGGWVRDKLLSASQRGRSTKTPDIDLLIDGISCQLLDKQLSICRQQWKRHPFPSFPFNSSFPLNFVLLPKKKTTTNPYLQLVTGFYTLSSGKKISIDIAQLSPVNYYDLLFSGNPLYDASVGKEIETTLDHEQQSRSQQASSFSSEESKILVDACYRDLTINSLYYNIRTGQTEDFTGMGLSDLLSNRLLRTPLSSPKLTVLSNPLTTLRIIRFACRLNFTIEKELFSYCCSVNGSKRINEVISSKISKYRLQKEFSAIISSSSVSSFARGIYLLHRMSLLPAAFPIRETVLPLLSSMQQNSQQKECKFFSKRLMKDRFIRMVSFYRFCCHFHTIICKTYFPVPQRKSLKS